MESTRGAPGLPPAWVPDSEAPECALCSVKFGVVTRRHHCRACGAVVCGPCSPEKLRVPDLSIHTLQRVCSRCFKAHSLAPKWAEETQTAERYLASHPGFVLSSPLFHTSRRDAREKSCFLVTESVSGREFLLTSVLPGKDCPVPFSASDSSRLALPRVLISGLHHPYLWPVTASSFLPEEGRALVLCPWAPRGSIKDLVHRANPKSVYGNKYGDAGTPHTGKPLPPKEVALFGRQILEALAYLRSRGLQTSHLHSGNVLVQDNTCFLSDVVVNELLCLPPVPLGPGPTTAHHSVSSAEPGAGATAAAGAWRGGVPGRDVGGSDTVANSSSSSTGSGGGGGSGPTSGLVTSVPKGASGPAGAVTAAGRKPGGSSSSSSSSRLSLVALKAASEQKQRLARSSAAAAARVGSATQGEEEGEGAASLSGPEAPGTGPPLDDGRQEAEVLSFGRLLHEMVTGQVLNSNKLPSPMLRSIPPHFGQVLLDIFSPGSGELPTLNDLLGMEVFAKVQLLADVGYIHQAVLDPKCVHLLEQVKAASQKSPSTHST